MFPKFPKKQNQTEKEFRGVLSRLDDADMAKAAAFAAKANSLLASLDAEEHLSTISILALMANVRLNASKDYAAFLNERVIPSLSVFCSFADNGQIDIPSICKWQAKSEPLWQ